MAGKVDQNMIPRFPQFCLIAILLMGCKSPAGKSAKSVLEVSPNKQADSKVVKGAHAGLEITSDDVQQDDEKQTATFTGNVDMRHPDFRLKCDHLLIYMNEGTADPGIPFKQAIATGARVIVKRTLNKGVKEVGESRKAVFEPKTGDIVLSEGPLRLQSGKALISTTSPNAIIVLRKDGSHRVINNGSFRIGLGVSSKTKLSALKEWPINALDTTAPVRPE